MTIYVLDNDLKLCAQYLDDRSLNTMIKDIAQVLCNVHHMGYSSNRLIPLSSGKDNKNSNSRKWTYWARECKANYLYLVELGFALCDEFEYRTQGIKGQFVYYKFKPAIQWARENVPALRDCAAISNSCRVKNCDNITLFPLVIPKKYIIDCSSSHDNNYMAIESYRNYYQANLRQKLNSLYNDFCSFRRTKQECDKELNWTNHTKPEWVRL